MEHSQNMAGNLPTKIDPTLAGSLPESDFVERPGFEDNEAYWDEVQRIADETERDGGIPLEDVVRWVESWGTESELPPPEPRPRNVG